MKPLPLPSRLRPRLRKLAREPWTPAARSSPALAKWCGSHGYLTPNFAIIEMADTQTRKLPLELRSAARRHCFALEQLRHWLAEEAGKPVAVTIDGPTRTRQHNRSVHGAIDSQHVHGCASDHFDAQVRRWVAAIQRHGEVYMSARHRLKLKCDDLFTGVGNEGSGTFHLDSRPGAHVDFTTWVGQ